MSNTSYSKLWELNYKAIQLVQEHKSELEKQYKKLLADEELAWQFLVDTFGEDDAESIRRNINMLATLPQKQIFTKVFYEELLSNTLLYKLLREHKILEKDMSALDILFQTWISTLRVFQQQIDFVILRGMYL